MYMWAQMQQQNTLHTAFFSLIFFSFLKNKFQLFWNLNPSTDLHQRIATIRGKGTKVSSIHDPKIQQCIEIWWTSPNLVPCRAHYIGSCRPEHQSGQLKCNVGRTSQKQGWLLSLIFSLHLVCWWKEKCETCGAEIASYHGYEVIALLKWVEITLYCAKDR